MIEQLIILETQEFENFPSCKYVTKDDDLILDADILGREVSQYKMTYSAGDHQVTLSLEVFDQCGV